MRCWTWRYPSGCVPNSSPAPTTPGSTCKSKSRSNPFVIPGLSDGGAHTKYLTGGIYSTEYMIKYVRENHAMSLEDAHWKLSALPAYCAGFTDRGMLREGYAADIVIYEYDNLKMQPQEVAHDLPAGEWRRIQRADGYRYMLINGEVDVRRRPAHRHQVRPPTTPRRRRPRASPPRRLSK